MARFPENPILLAAIESLLDGERTAPGLVTSWQAPIEQASGRSVPAASADFDELVRRLRSFAIRLRSGSEAETRPGLALDSMMAAPEVEQVSPDEEAAETRLLGGLLGRGAGTVVSNPATVVLNEPFSDAMLSFSGVESQLVPVAATVQPGQILIRVVHGGIEQAQDADAVSIGFYPGTRPQDAFAALDASVSAALRTRAPEGTGPSKSSPAADSGGLFRNYVERGLLRAPFGQHFLFPDPRENPHCFPRSLQKIIAICSMGTPGRFGQPELVVLVRELAWSLGAVGCHKLATVLIGARQNLSLQEAASGWLRGLARAADQKPRQGNLLECVTFVEASYSRATDLHKALQSVVLSFAKKKTTPNLFAIGPAPVEDEAYSKARHSAAEQLRASDFDEDDDPIATRVFVERQGKTWSLSAMTDKAAVPERLVTVDPTLVDQATRSLAGQIDADYQRRYGLTLETLVIPKDLREHLYGSAPLVLVVDATTARVPWEMLAQPLERSQVTEKPQRGHVPTEHFVGLTRGLTRQLRTQFAQYPRTSDGGGT